MAQLLFFVPALAFYFGLLYGCWWLWAEDATPVIAVVAFLIVAPLGFAALFALAHELWTDHPQYTLDQRYWECGASHREPVTTYVKSGNVMIPITSYQTVCDGYVRKP